MSRAQRLVMTLATALCAWLWCGVAAAAQDAPRCDDRAATTFAKPPTMQPMMRTLQVFVEEEGCVTEDHADVCGQQRCPSPPPNPVQGDPLLPASFALEVPFALQSGLLGPAPATLLAAPAHVASLERPPRA